MHIYLSRMCMITVDAVMMNNNMPYLSYERNICMCLSHNKLTVAAAVELFYNRKYSSTWNTENSNNNNYHHQTSSFVAHFLYYRIFLLVLFSVCLFYCFTHLQCDAMRCHCRTFRATKKNCVSSSICFIYLFIFPNSQYCKIYSVNR